MKLEWKITILEYLESPERALASMSTIVNKKDRRAQLGFGGLISMHRRFFFGDKIKAN